jgi:hypothetical protein
MRGPDAEARGGCGNRKPYQAHVAAGFAHMMQKTDGREGSQSADQCRQSDKPKVVVIDDAVLDREHVMIACKFRLMRR